jgi:hypothetical protein
MKYKCIIQSLWIVTALQCISTEVNVKGFKKCCLSNVMDGNVRSWCEEDEGTDCEGVDSDTDW